MDNSHVFFFFHLVTVWCLFYSLLGVKACIVICEGTARLVFIDFFVPDVFAGMNWCHVGVVLMGSVFGEMLVLLNMPHGFGCQFIRLQYSPTEQLAK